MTPFAAEAVRTAAPQLAFAAILGVVAFYCLLPRPNKRYLTLGTFLAIAAFATFASIISNSWGGASRGTVEQILFWLFSTGAVLFGIVLVSQRNPARGAIAFAFVIMCVSGLFLLLAAPFLMAATIIVYAGAIIVTFLFVLMLSHTAAMSDENDRSREPLLGALAGFAFIGLILFGLQQSSGPIAASPTPPLTTDDESTLTDLLNRLNAIPLTGRTTADIVRATDEIRLDLDVALAKIEARTRFLESPLPPPWSGHAKRVNGVRQANKAVENALTKPGVDGAGAIADLNAELRLFIGSAHLPARNVGPIGLLLYSEHLLAVEMAGTLLLVAAIGAVAIAGRKGAKA
jgi:NADH-quinone oxidoreductase subunit J